MTSPQVRIINRPNLLKAKASRSGGKSFDDLVKVGNTIVAGHHTDYRTVAQSDLHELQSLLDGIRSTPDGAGTLVDGVFGIAHDMKGQATTFGYPMITNVAASLCRFIERITVADRSQTSDLRAFSEIIKLHVDALHLLLQHDIKGPGGQLETSLLSGLHAASEKILADLAA